MAPGFFSPRTFFLPRSPTTSPPQSNPIVQPPHPCPDCTCHRTSPATQPSQPASQHQRFCLRHHIKPNDLAANTRIFQSDAIKNGFKGLFTGGLPFANNQASFHDLSSKQRQALESYTHVLAQLPLGLSTRTPFPLTPFFNLCDEYFFCGALRGRVDIVWVDICPGEGQKGYTTDAPGPLHRAEISIKRPLLAGYEMTWTKSITKAVLESLLHEMVHALFNVYECRCVACTVVENQAMNTGVRGSGHGPQWRELGWAVQEEAGKMFGGWEGRWDLNVGRWGGAHVEEVRRVLEMRREGMIEYLDGLLDALLA